MLIAKAMVRIERVRSLWGIRVVNRYSHEGFLFAPQFLNMCSDPGRHILLRVRDTQSGLVRPSEGIGDVIGVVTSTEYGNRLSLYFGSASEPLAIIDPFKPPVNAQKVEHYDFVGDELDIHRRYLELVSGQTTAFEMALLGAEIYPEPRD